MPKPAHYRGSYHTQSARIRARAYANPATTCWRCGLTLAQVRQHHPHAKWTAGHIIDGQPGGPMAPEDSWCNYSQGAKLRHARAKRTALTW